MMMMMMMLIDWLMDVQNYKSMQQESRLYESFSELPVIYSHDEARPHLRRL
jgi:hypothetical protein